MASHSEFCLYMPPLSSITTYQEMVDLAAEYGIRQLETLNILDLSTPDLTVARELKAYAAKKGISFPCVSLGLDLVLDDHEAALEEAKQYVEIAAILGSPYFHHTIALNFSDPQLTADHFDLFYQRGLKAVRALYDHAQSFGIRTIYEDQGFLFNGVENFSRFLRDVDRNIGVVADFGNIQFVDQQVEDFIRTFRDRIVHVHVKDYRVSQASGEYTTWGGNYLTDCLIDDGSVHTAEAFRALKEMGYQGSVSLECNPIGPDETASFRHNLAAVTRYLDTYL